MKSSRWFYSVITAKRTEYSHWKKVQWITLKGHNIVFIFQLIIFQMRGYKLSMTVSGNLSFFFFFFCRCLFVCFKIFNQARPFDQMTSYLWSLKKVSVKNVKLFSFYFHICIAEWTEGLNDSKSMHWEKFS